MRKFSDGSAVFFARQKRHDIFAVRKPGEKTVERKKHEYRDHIGIVQFPRVAEIEDESLRHGQKTD